ncbi:MAG TPA: hypothetical protein VFT64_09865 [Rickettsiales bacterium]|nr:hypothetical protein [Rickettsiales bacterium]
MAARRIKLIPVTMLAAFLLLGLKVGETLRDGRRIALSFEEAHAQQAQPPATPPATPAPAAPAAPAGENKTAPAPAAGGEGKAAPAEGAGNTNEAAEEESAKHEFSQVEIDLLQSLAKRRQELDEWAKQVQLRQNMLNAVEERIDEKTEKLEKMKQEVETLLAKYNEQEDTKIRSLVKIYESMKPKDAARIFEELDMPVLLMVVDKMSERKVAGILANMSPGKAKDVTIQLAEQRKLQRNRVGAALSPNAPAPAAPPAQGGR